MSQTGGRASSKAIWVGVALSLVAVVLLLWKVSFHDLWDALTRADVKWLLPSLALFFVTFAFRAWRWGILLGGTPFGSTWHANTIGYFFNVTLPLRLGEIARAFVIVKTEKVTMARALSAVVVERMMDLAFVVLLFAWFAQRVPMRPAFTRAATVGSIALAFCVVLGAAIVVKGDAVVRAIRPRLEVRLGALRTEKFLGRVIQIQEALRAVGSLRRTVQCLLLSVLVWASTIALTAACLRAFLPDDPDLTKPGLVVVMANLGGALPSAPAGLGIVQGFATSALVVPFHVPEGTALAFVLVWSLGQLLLVVLLGFVSLGRVGLSFREIRAGAHGATVSAPADDGG